MEKNYYGRIARRKLYINETYRKRRLHKGASWWRNVIFCGESKFSIFGSDGPHKLWQKPTNSCKYAT